MGKIDLERYKNAWKNEKSFDERKLSANEIARFIKSSSNGILQFFRNGLIIDIIFKISLLASLVPLVLLLPAKIFINRLSLFIAIIIITGLIWQINVWRKVPKNMESGTGVIDKLREYIGFYYKYQIKSILVGAISGGLFFLIGSLYYFTIKYNGIPQFQTDDVVVLITGILLGYGLNAVVQLKQHGFRISQLEKILEDIKENNVDSASIKNFDLNLAKNTLIFGLALIAGVILFLYLILKQII